MTHLTTDSKLHVSLYQIAAKWGWGRRGGHSRSLLCIAFCIALLMPIAPAVAGDWVYTVRPGDKLWTLAEKYCGSYTRWRELAAHNQLSQPTRLQAGTRLQIPVEWLIEEPAAARVIYTRGDAQLHLADGSPGQALALGDMLSVADKVVTGEESYINIQFADGSTLQVGPESELVFDTLSAYRDTGMVDSRVRVNRGSAASEVNPQVGPGSVYRISTPLGVAAVRGTEFRTRAANGASFVETVGGAVEFIAAAGTTDVSKGFGLKADSQGVNVEQLLSEPKLQTRQAFGANERVEWADLSGAATYLVSVYSGPDLAEILDQATVPAAAFALASIDPGSYVLGVRGISASGLQGFEATQPLTVQASLAAPEGVRVKQQGRENLLVEWRPVQGAVDYQVVAQPAGGGAPLTLTSESNQVQLQGLQPDTYSVSVQARAQGIQGETSVPTERRLKTTRPWGIGGILLAIAIAL